MSNLYVVTVPKWGLSMEEGQVLAWHKQEGDAVAEGEELVDVETSKITNAVEAPASGILQRIVATAGTTLPCGAIMAVIGPPGTPAETVDMLVAEQQALMADAIRAGGDGGQVQPQLRDVVVAGEPRRLRYIDAGSGDATVVLLHGFGGDLDNWMFTWPALAAVHRVIVVDLPGHGSSHKQVGDATAATLALDVAALLDEVAPGDMHLVAHSFGAAVATELAYLRPSLLRSFTAIAPADLAPVNLTYIDGFIKARRRSEMSATLAQLFATPGLAGKDMAESLLRYKRLDGVETALRAISAANFGSPRPVPAALALWRDIGARGMLIWGSDDAIVPRAGMDAVDPSVQRRVVVEAGHMPHVEKADEVNRILLEHLGRV